MIVKDNSVTFWPSYHKGHRERVMISDHGMVLVAAFCPGQILSLPRLRWGVSLWVGHSFPGSCSVKGLCELLTHTPGGKASPFWIMWNLRSMCLNSLDQICLPHERREGPVHAPGGTLATVQRIVSPSPLDICCCTCSRKQDGDEGSSSAAKNTGEKRWKLQYPGQIKKPCHS